MSLIVGNAISIDVDAKNKMAIRIYYLNFNSNMCRYKVTNDGMPI
jgi:hypothetical protein